MRLNRLSRGIKFGALGALVPALGLVNSFISSVIIGLAGFFAVGLGTVICYAAGGFRKGVPGALASVAFSGFIGGLLWSLNYFPAPEISPAYIAAFVSCSCGAVFKIGLTTPGRLNFFGALGGGTGFLIFSIILGLTEYIISFSPAQKLFAAGIIYLFLDSVLTNRKETIL